MINSKYLEQITDSDQLFWFGVDFYVCVSEIFEISSPGYQFESMEQSFICTSCYCWYNFTVPCALLRFKKLRVVVANV